MRRWKNLRLIPVLLVPACVVAAVLVVGYLHVTRQGFFDPPLVRFARAMSANDAPSVDFARAIVADRTRAWKTPWFHDAVGNQFEPGDISDAVAVTHAMLARNLRPMASFDWKEGGEEVANAIEDMLAYYELPPPSEAEGAAILAEAEREGSKYTQIPIMIARYDGYFRKSGHLLALVNIGSDSYGFVALPPTTARCWKDVDLKAEREAKYGGRVHVEAAIVQSVEFTNDRAPELKELAANEKAVRLRDPPTYACLPFWAIF